MTVQENVKYCQNIIDGMNETWENIDNTLTFRRNHNRLVSKIAETFVPGYYRDEILDCFKTVFEVEAHCLERNIIEEFGDILINYERVYVSEDN